MSVGGKTWTTAQGNTIPLAEMSDRHIENCIVVLATRVRDATTDDDKAEALAAHVTLIDEKVRRRGLDGEIVSARSILDGGKAKKQLPEAARRAQSAVDALDCDDDD